jgi:hypothetical protein
MTSIYCPKCEYHPLPGDRWVCSPGCFTMWNTFETHARCPGCARQWGDTCCPACARWSPHEEWYHDDDVIDERVKEAIEELIRAPAPARV